MKISNTSSINFETEGKQKFNNSLAEIMAQGINRDAQSIDMNISFTKTIQQKLTSIQWLEEMKTNTDKVISMIDQNRQDPMLKNLLTYKEVGDDTKLDDTNDTEDASPWACVVCTFINERENGTCTICESPAPLPGMPRTFLSLEDETQWRRNLAVNSEIDAQDKIGEWFRGNIVQYNDDQVLVHFLGWPSLFDEWIDRNSPRLSLRHSHYTEYGPKFRDKIPPERKRNTLFIPVPYIDTIRYSDVKLLKENPGSYIVEIPSFPPIEYPKHLMMTTPSNNHIIHVDKLLSSDEKLFSQSNNNNSSLNDVNIKPFRNILAPNNPVSHAINEFASVYRPYSPGSGYTSSHTHIGSAITLKSSGADFVGQIVDEDSQRYKICINSIGEIWVDKKQFQNL